MTIERRSRRHPRLPVSSTTSELQSRVRRCASCCARASADSRLTSIYDGYGMSERQCGRCGRPLPTGSSVCTYCQSGILRWRREATIIISLVAVGVVLFGVAWLLTRTFERRRDSSHADHGARRVSNDGVTIGAQPAQNAGSQTAAQPLVTIFT